MFVITSFPPSFPFLFEKIVSQKAVALLRSMTLGSMSFVRELLPNFPCRPTPPSLNSSKAWPHSHANSQRLQSKQHHGYMNECMSSKNSKTTVMSRGKMMRHGYLRRHEGCMHLMIHVDLFHDKH